MKDFLDQLTARATPAWTVIVILATGVIIAAVVRASDSLGDPGRGLDAPTVASPDANTRQLARSIFSDNVFSFELATAILLVAVVGTVLLSRRMKEDSK